MDKIYKSNTIEGFLLEFGLVDENDLDEIADKIRYEKSKVFKIDIDDGVVKIKNGIYAGNSAKILSQYANKFEVKIKGDKYGNVIVIDTEDVAYESNDMKNIYILE